MWILKIAFSSHSDKNKNIITTIYGIVNTLYRLYFGMKPLTSEKKEKYKEFNVMCKENKLHDPLIFFRYISTFITECYIAKGSKKIKSTNLLQR